ncbi:hypothetical protein FDA94_16220 [Herbidospora galbida]|uniref:WxL domain-containing protein n=1 Tax=Herbidospora galbida TaxID=2575442 RepID=A0A4U3MER4_9ACTN|nr:hypothetical protein [Herbidospora galbida]TKK87725.1 hypothetical protein FDA94_16220 [Herbidospora galbida]
MDDTPREEAGDEGAPPGGILDGTQEKSAQGGPPPPARSAPRRKPGKSRDHSAKRLANAGLAITAPTSRALGSTTIGGQLSAQLGTVAVSDTRGSVTQISYTATVSATNFTTTVGGNTSTISKPNISYWSGPATAVSGVGVFTPGQLAAANAIALTGSHTAFAVTSAVGNTSVSWNPTIIVRVPSSAAAGSYSGTITHSVA